jgi:hypothetical protein
VVIVNPLHAQKASPEIQDSSDSAGSKHVHTDEKHQGIKESPQENSIGMNTVTQAGPIGGNVDPEKVLDLPSGTILHLYKKNTFYRRAMVVNVNGVPEIYLSYKKEHIFKTRPLRVFEKSLFLQWASGVPYVAEYGDGKPRIFTTEHPSGRKILARTDGYPVIFKSESKALKKVEEITSLGVDAQVLNLGRTIKCVAIMNGESCGAGEWILLNFNAFHKVFFEKNTPAKKKLTAKGHPKKKGLHKYRPEYPKMAVFANAVDQIKETKSDPQTDAMAMTKSSIPTPEEMKAIEGILGWTDDETISRWSTWLVSIKDKPTANEDFFLSQVDISMPLKHLIAYGIALIETNRLNVAAKVFDKLRNMAEEKRGGLLKVERNEDE